MLVTLGGNSARSEEKNLCFQNRLLLRASSQTLTPVLCRELFPPRLQQQKTGQTDIITSTLELLKRRQLSHGLLHLPVPAADSAGNGMWNLGPAHFGLPFRGCPIYFSWSSEHRITSALLTQSREDEDSCLILCYPNYWSNYFHQHNGTDYILNQ